MGSRQERREILGVARGNTSPLLDVQEGVLYQVPMAIQVLVIDTLHLAIPAGRNLHPHALLPGLGNKRITVIPLVCHQVLGLHALNQGDSFCAIRPGTRRSKNSERHTMRIHGQMYLGVEPPFVRPMP